MNDKIKHCPCCGELINVSAMILNLIEKVTCAGFKPVAAILNDVLLNKLVEEMGPMYNPRGPQSEGAYIMFSGLRLKFDEDVKKIRIEVEA